MKTNNQNAERSKKIVPIKTYERGREIERELKSMVFNGSIKVTDKSAYADQETRIDLTLLHESFQKIAWAAGMNTNDYIEKLSNIFSGYMKYNPEKSAEALKIFMTLSNFFQTIRAGQDQLLLINEDITNIQSNLSK